MAAHTATQTGCNLRAKPNLTHEQMNMLGQFLHKAMVGGKLPRGFVAVAATKFGVTRRTIFNYLRTVVDQKNQGKPVNLKSKKGGVLRTKRVKLDEEKMKAIQFHKRGTIRNLSEALGVSKSTLGRWKKQGVIRAHTNAIKPGLTYANCLARLIFCLESLSFDAENDKVHFKCMNHVIHLDEKWFYITKTSERYYICEGEEEPHRTCQSKRFITKVMFLCAVTRPLYDSEGNCIFYGKIGMWPFTKKESAKRNSKNRQKGTPITVAMASVNKEVTKEMLLTQVLPAIKAKWPSTLSKDIIIQWDNAPPHINNNDVDFRTAASADGYNIQLQFQPPNSPDTNINDLGWFNSLDAMRTSIQAETVDQLVDGVQESFEKLTDYTLNKLFISLQSTLRQIMTVRGANNYSLEHLRKDALARNGQLPTNLTVNKELVMCCISANRAKQDEERKLEEKKSRERKRKLEAKLEEEKMRELKRKLAKIVR